jgi:DNA-binding transcriptional regulator of glucitol operon
MEFWLSAIFFLIIIACLCLIVHWQAKRRRAKTQS